MALNAKEIWMLPGPLIFPLNINVSIWVSGSQCVQNQKRLQSGYDPRNVWCMETGLDHIKLSLQIKIHVMQMSDLQYVRHRYICAVNFLNVDTCTAYCILACIPLHLIDTRLGITTCTDVDMERWNENWTEVHNFYVWHSFARWYPITVQFNWGGSFAHSSIKTLLLMHSEFWPAWVSTCLDPCGKHKILGTFLGLEQIGWTMKWKGHLGTFFSTERCPTTCGLTSDLFQISHL